MLTVEVFPKASTMKLLVLFAFVTSSLSEVILNQYKIENNPEFNNFTIKVWRESGKGSVANVTIQSLATVEKILLYLKVTLEDNNAQSERVFLNTVFDVNKVFAGVYSNPLAKAFTGSFFKSVDFELKFPFKPGTYKFKNLSIDDTFIPLISSVKGHADLRFVGRVAGRKTQAFFAKGTLKWELIRGAKV